MIVRPSSGLDAAERVLVMTRVLNASRELVFEAWTNPAHLQRWWGPKDFPAVQLDMDIRPGGIWRGCLRSVADGRELWHKGVFREVVADDLAP